MQQIRTKAIILTRVNYGEADRIITFLTPDQGKVTAIAKSVRKTKSKLAGGIELFSVSDIGFIVGKREISTLISTRLIKYYSNIVKDTERTATAYNVIKIINKATEDKPEASYFDLVEETFKALDDFDVQPEVARLWFEMQLLKFSGHTPNLRTDSKGRKLLREHTYDFQFDGMNFEPVDKEAKGVFDASHIQFLRIGFSNNSAHVLSRIKDVGRLVQDSQPLIQTMLQNFVIR